MTPRELARRRLASQSIPAGRRTVAEAVESLGALQAQDYGASLWAIGTRVAAATATDIEDAIADRKILRTWPMRGTLHFVPAADAAWMLALTTPRVIAGSRTRHRQLELDEAVFSRAKELFIDALQGGRKLTRDALFGLLEADGIATRNQRGYHLLWKHAQDGLICCGPREGKQPTFVLLAEWVPHPRRMERDEALGTLGRRYFTGHGPATLQDFVWWSGLTVADGKRAVSLAGPELEALGIGGIPHWMAADAPEPQAAGVHLLPGFDEFLLGYKDRSAMLAAEHAPKIVPGNNGMFLPMIVEDGRITGTWKRTLRGRSAAVRLDPFSPLPPRRAAACLRAAEAYGRFLGLPVEAEFA